MEQKKAAAASVARVDSLIHAKAHQVARAQRVVQLGENRLLKMLGPHELSLLQPNLKTVAMTRGAVLHWSGEPIDYVYFPVGALVSILTVMKTGEQIETGIIGREGVAGASMGIWPHEVVSQATVQIAGAAWQLQRRKFLELCESSEVFRDIISRFENSLFVQVQQSAACRGLHTLSARLCRLLLQFLDAIGGDTLPLTQEFLAEMLGVQRTAVNMFSQKLQQAKVLEYHRGQIKVLDRGSLERAACECYAVVRRYLDEVLPST